MALGDYPESGVRVMTTDMWMQYYIEITVADGQHALIGDDGYHDDPLSTEEFTRIINEMHYSMHDIESKRGTVRIIYPVDAASYRIAGELPGRVAGVRRSRKIVADAGVTIGGTELVYTVRLDKLQPRDGGWYTVEVGVSIGVDTRVKYWIVVSSAKGGRRLQRLAERAALILREEASRAFDAI